MTQSASFDSLLAALKRAEETHLTDEDSAKLEAGKKLSQDILDLALNLHADRGGPLDTRFMLTAAAISLGLLIRISTNGGLAGALAVATYIQTVLSIATQED